MATTATPSRSKKYKFIFGLEYFYSRYKRKYAPHLIGHRGKNPRKISQETYKKILHEYFDIYLKEIYFKNEKSYFLYTGVMEKVYIREKIKERIVDENQKVYHRFKEHLNLMWYQRPSILFYLGVRLQKMKSSLAAYKIHKIENLYESTTDIKLIANFEQVYEQQMRNRNIFLK